jgi:carboxymethylenebutenolidase
LRAALAVSKFQSPEENSMDIKNDLASLAPRTEFSRRDFVVTMLAVGFAAAVRPIAAQTVIQTDDQGLVAGEVKIPVKDGQVPAYRAMPAKGSHFPVILVVQEIFGVHEHIKDVCRRLAKLGYLAVAPELYARQGDVAKMTNIQEILETVVAKVPDAKVLADLDATADWARKNGGDSNKLAITGFCWGGRIVWLYAAHNPRLKAAVAWYGRLTGNKDALHPQQPIEMATSLKAPVLGLYGGADQGIPVEVIEQFRRELQGAHAKSEIVIYPDAPHGFHADYRPSYRQGPAEDGWKRMRAWFKQYGVG